MTSKENISKDLMLDIAIEYREHILRFQKRAFKQAEPSKKKVFNHLMFCMMNLAFWLRVDLELLLRVAYWQGLSEADLGNRFLGDQENLINNYSEISDDAKKIIQKILNDLKILAQKNNLTPITPENNGKIVNNLKYRSKELKALYKSFYKILSKFSHPDPHFLCFPKDYKHQIEEHVLPIFKKCRKRLDDEWDQLRNYLENSK